jgi:DNA primase
VVPKLNKPLGFALPLDPGYPYLKQRGLSPELVATFGLGYCAKGIMAGRVCIPIQNAEGATVAYAGRWAGKLEELPEGKGKYELPAGFKKELELFNLHRVKHCRHLVVVEGYFSAIRLHGARSPAVALMGASISLQQLELLAHANARHITIMLDGDEAGRAAADEVAGAIAKIAWARIVHLPNGRQPDRVDRAELEQLLGRIEK